MRSVLLFARSPEREAAAKRLPSAAPLFRALVRAWLHAASASGAVPLVACDARDREALARIAPEIAREWIEQGDGRFGERVAAAAGEAFARGYAQVIVAAIDAPPLELDAAFAALERGVSVVAPAKDGGVNFIGLPRPEPQLLAQLTPNRRDLVALCRQQLNELLVLDVVTDVDSAHALNAARHERAWRDYVETPAFTPRKIAQSICVPRNTLPPRAPPSA